MARRGRQQRPGGRPGGRKRRPPRERPGLAGPSMPDTPEAELEEQTRKDILEIVKARTADRGLDENERLLARVLDQHPEHADDFANASDHKVTGDFESPFLHAALHRIVEQRVVTRELSDQMSRLTRDKSWHDAVHEVADAIALEMFGAEEAEAL
jgi:hypothetical protein